MISNRRYGSTCVHVLALKAMQMDFLGQSYRQLVKLGCARNHRAGTSDHPFQKTRKSGFACITLLSRVRQGV